MYYVAYTSPIRVVRLDYIIIGTLYIYIYICICIIEYNCINPHLLINRRLRVISYIRRFVGLSKRGNRLPEFTEYLWVFRSLKTASCIVCAQLIPIRGQQKAGWNSIKDWQRLVPLCNNNNNNIIHQSRVVV